MRSTFVCVLTLLICNLSFEFRRTTPIHQEMTVRPAAILAPESLDEDSKLLAPITVGGLTLFPIVANEPVAGNDVLSLDEAMRTHELRIREVDDGNVNELSFANASDQPVFVLAGEVILGGKQDRIVSTTTVIPPHSTEAVPVRCVEHGRWKGETNEFTTAETLAHDRLRATATYATQVDVWAEVKQLNERNDTANGTDTYRTLAMRQAEDARNHERTIDAAIAALPRADRQRMIGYAIAYNGEVSAVDKFRSPALFGKLERKLLRSYIAQSTETVTITIKEPCVHALRDFVANAKSGDEETAFTTNLSSTLIKRGTIASTSWVNSGERHLYSNYLGNSRIVQSPQRRWICDRHLYPSYQGNAQANDECWAPAPYDRHLYPSYLGNNPGGQGRQPVPDPTRCEHWLPDRPCDDVRNYLGGNPPPRAPNGRLRRTDEEPRLHCERSLHPGYIGNTRAWNECRRAKGLPVAEPAPQ